jgi:hypothetical protein
LTCGTNVQVKLWKVSENPSKDVKNEKQFYQTESAK